MNETYQIILSQYFDFIDDDTIRIKGHRIGIEHVLSHYLEGFTPEEIAQEFPGLDLEKIYVTITYYLTNRQAINKYLHNKSEREEQEYQLWKKTPSPLIQRLRTIREEQEKYK
ncbi:MAG: DUF433 domain-containing protein [Chloroflexota bacterium]|nr:DUF433 domain-containing protein [Chloroflexota bacterium]